MKSFKLLSLLLIICGHVWGQGTFSISGKIIDKQTQQPVAFASVSAFEKSFGKLVDGAVSDTSGAFTITGLKSGFYMLQIDFIGYEKKKVDSLRIATSNLVVKPILLSPSEQLLQAVNITAKAEIVENKIDKIVYNVANDVTSQGGAAIDVLKKVPQVTVDIDGNVELQGNPNVRFLINGKPSSAFGNSLADALASIPAGQIKSVEAITTPGSKYDAQGTGGIINIILKENRLQGINGSVNVSAGTRLENTSLNLNMRKSNFGINAFFSGNRQLSSKTPSVQDRISTNDTDMTSTRLVQEGVTNFKRSGYQSGLGFDWNITNRDILNGSLGFSHFGSENTGIIAQRQMTQDNMQQLISDISTNRKSFSASGIDVFDWNLNYKRKFKKAGEELEITYIASYGKPGSNYVQTQTYMENTVPYNGVRSNNPGTDHQTNIAIDYVNPLSKHLLLETGVKKTVQNINSVTNVDFWNANQSAFISDPGQSYTLGYKMSVWAGYISASYKVFKWLDMKTGLRLEHTDVHIDFPNTSIPSYNTLVPSVIFSHEFQKDQSIKLAYSRRIERPEYRELNPFVNMSDPYNITTGNPLLHPEIGDNIELGYAKSFKSGGSIYVALVERINSHDLKQITTFYPTYMIQDSAYTNVSVTRRENIGVEYNSGLVISGSMPVTEHLNVRANIQLTHKYIVSNENFGNLSTGFRNRYNMNLTYQFPGNTVMEVFGNYSQAARSVQGRTPQSLTYTFAVRKQFWHKNASIGLTATNPFNKYVGQLTTIITDQYVSTSLRQIPYRSFGISFSYKFGKLEFKKGREQNHDYLNNPPESGN